MTYIEDMPAKLAEAHLVIARSGASTVAELTAAGRPAILIPYPEATDDHQTANARDIAEAGGARMIHQPLFTPTVLAKQIEAMAEDPQALINAAARSLSVGKPHAASNLADLVERIGQGLAPIEVGFGLTPRVGSRRPARGMPRESVRQGRRHDPLRRHRGIGMSGIAEVMHQLGYKVQGSDIAEGYIVEGCASWAFRSRSGSGPKIWAMPPSSSFPLPSAAEIRKSRLRSSAACRS